MAEKIFLPASIVMTLARLRRHPPGLQTSLPVAGNVRFVADASPGHSPTAGTAARSSIATTAALAPGTPRCNTAPSDASAENSSRILSVNTAGSVAGGRSLSSSSGFVDFFEKLLNDLDRGSWERLLPEGSSLGAGMPPLSEAPFILSLCRRPRSAFALAELYQTSFILLTAKSHAAPGRRYSATRQWRPGSPWSATVVPFFAATDR